MKKIFLSLILMLGLASATMAQTDTIFNRCEHYYYTGWYDTLDLPYGSDYGFRLQTIMLNHISGTQYVKREHTSEEIAVKGVAVYVMRSVADFPWMTATYWSTDSIKLPEYAFIGKTSDTGFVTLDSAQWDTAQAKLVQLRQTCTSMDSLAYCHSYEGYFKTPVRVNGNFYVGATDYCNQRFWDNQIGDHYRYVPSVYIGVQYQGNWNLGYTATPIFTIDNGVMTRLSDHLWGLFFPIVDFYDIEVLSADSAMGSVEGGGRYSDFTDHILTAIPNEGYCFSHWSDGSTESPRILTVSQDSSLTAFFTEVRPAIVEVHADNDAYGYVEGGGEYLTCDEVTITAIPNEDCRFHSWSDGSTDNPRTFTLVFDTSFTAIFEIRVGIDDAEASPAFSLTPNPARDIVTVTLSGSCNAARATLTLRDALGKELRRITPSADKTDIPLSGLPAGTYLLTLSTPQGSSTQKLIVE